jgi:DNA repair exonuclease SbcCD ATPase subunit
MIIFEKVRWKNFLSYGNSWCELDLNKHKDTLIIGENGAGKSTFLDALSYALYMKPFRKVNNPQLVNSINKKHLKVEVEFKVGGNHYKVVRGHAPRLFEVYQNGDLLNQDAHTKDYQKVLEQSILKMSYKSFTQIVVLGSRNFVPFMQLSGADRRTVIEDLLDIQIFSTMASLLKDKLADNRSQLQQVDYDVNLLEEKITIQNQYLEDIAKDKKQQLNKIKLQIKEKQDKVSELQSELALVEGHAKELLEQCAPLESVSQRVQQLIALEGQIESKITKLKRQLKFYEDNSDCPTCGQEIDDEFKRQVTDETDSSITETETGLTQLETQIQTQSARISDLKRIQDEATEAERNAGRLKAEISSINSVIEGMEKEVEESTSENNNSDHAATKVQELTDELEITQKRKVALRQQQTVFNTAQVLLKDTGIKSKIIKQYVPVMNKLINKYLAAMEFFVDFHLDEDFKETIRSRHRDDFAYASFSEGEKMRIDLSLLFTWRAIAKLKNSASTNILIMDEIFDSSLDASGTDEFLKIIKELTSDTSIVIISHKTDQLLDKFSNVVRFEKHKNFSRIAE